MASPRSASAALASDDDVWDDDMPGIASGGSGGSGWPFRDDDSSGDDDWVFNSGGSGGSGVSGGSGGIDWTDD
ncbi:MAG: hypothetical protein U0031_11770 [Thermomicrobiales bacterium]